MKTNSLTKILSAAAFVAMLSASSSVFAQVKIGSNPATIGSNSNLEVEATNNQKVIISKDNGTLLIQNTPSGAITDSIVTVDASGNVRKISTSRFSSATSSTYLLSSSGSNEIAVNQGVTVPVPFTDNNVVIPSSAATDRSSSVYWVAPRAGVYRIELNATQQANNNTPATGVGFFFIVKNGASAPQNLLQTSTSLRTEGPGFSRGIGSASGSVVTTLAAGETISVNYLPCQGCGPNQYYVTTRSLVIERKQ